MGTGPKYSTIGRRVMYARKDLDAYIAERQTNTGKATDAAPAEADNTDRGTPG